jgi:hypothetical protein
VPVRLNEGAAQVLQAAEPLMLFPAVSKEIEPLDFETSTTSTSINQFVPIEPSVPPQFTVALMLVVPPAELVM